MEANRYKVVAWHGEIGSTYSVVDTLQPESDQPAVVRTWLTETEPHACWLAEGFCRRHNAKQTAEVLP